jgi:hypothetical protein
VQTWQNIDDFSAYWSNSQGRPVRELPPRGKMYDRLMTFSSGGYFQHDMNPDIRIRTYAPYNALEPPEGRLAGLQSKFLGFDDEGAKADVGAAPAAPPVQVRTNFQETAFFFPDLRTDSAGGVSFSFTMPESLTRWKWMTLAHTRDLAFGYSEKMIVTQKQLMVQPNMPRFLREGDKINLSVKVVNLTDSEMTGQIGLSLTDPTTGETADGVFLNRQPNQYFTVPARGSWVVDFRWRSLISTTGRSAIGSWQRRERSAMERKLYCR